MTPLYGILEQAELVQRDRNKVAWDRGRVGKGVTGKRHEEIGGRGCHGNVLYFDRGMSYRSLLSKLPEPYPKICGFYCM